MNERELARRLCEGDQAALGKIIDGYSAYVHTVAYNFARGGLSAQDIEEVAADVFYKLWKARGNIDERLGLRSYLSAMTRNAVSDRFRSSRNSAEDISELDIPSDFLIEDAAEMNAMMRCLEDGLRTLRSDEREIFFRFYFNGDKASQIAEVMGSTKSAVDTKLHRIRKKLREYLSKRGYDHVE